MELVVALLVALVVTPVAGRVARRLGVVDLPGPLKTHRSPVPYLGGVGVFAGAVVGAVVIERPGLLLPLGLALGLGIADDVRPRPPRLRLAVELVIAATGAAVVPGDAAARAATAGLVVVLLNAVNLLDGQDGLAAAVSLVSALAFAALGGDATPFGLALAGALAGFWVFNRPPARVYLGDGGAYFVGTALALLPALVGGGNDPLSVWCAVPLIVAVPVADTAIAVVRRMRAGRRVFEGDRSHVYDQLVDRGLGVWGSTVSCTAAQAVLAATGAVAAGLEPAWSLACAVLGAVVVAVVAVAGGFVGRARVEGAP